MKNMKIEIRNAFLVTAEESGRVYPKGTIQIEGTTIKYVGDAAKAPAFQAERTIEANGNIVMPGLYNTHTHLPMTLMRGFGEDMTLSHWLNDCIFPIEARLDGELAYLGTRLALIEMVKNGIVGVSDMYFFTDQIYRAVQEAGIKALLSRCVSGNTLADAKKGIDEAEDLLGMHDASGKIRWALALHAEYTCGNEVIAEMARRAKEKKMRLHVHVSETASEHEECKARHDGKTPMRLLYDLGAMEVPLLAAHCAYVDEEDIELMRQYHVCALHCPTSNLKLACGVAPVQDMLQQGVLVALGTDGAASNNAQSIFYDMQLAVLLQKGMTRDATAMPLDTAIRMATANGATALGFLDSGVLKEGNRADLIMVDTHSTRFSPKGNAKTHLVYNTAGMDVCLTMVDGKILYENRKVCFADENEAIAQFEEGIKRLYGN